MLNTMMENENNFDPFPEIMFTAFIKTKTFFKKLEYHFLVESTKIQDAIFP